MSIIKNKYHRFVIKAESDIIDKFNKGELENEDTQIDFLGKADPFSPAYRLFRVKKSIEDCDFGDAAKSLFSIDIGYDYRVSWHAMGAAHFLFSKGAISLDQLNQFLFDMEERQQDVYDNYAALLEGRIDEKFRSGTIKHYEEDEDLMFLEIMGYANNSD